MRKYKTVTTLLPAIIQKCFVASVNLFLINTFLITSTKKVMAANTARTEVKESNE